MNNTNLSKSIQSLKERRPLWIPKLEIPSILSVMEFEWSAPGVGVYAIKGKKTLLMEDAYKVLTFPQDKKGFFGVYDGHGGSMAAEYVAEHLHSNITSMLENCSGNEAKEEAIKAAYLKTNDDFLKQGTSDGACCVTVLIEGNQILVSNLGDCRAVLCRGGMAEPLTKDHKAGDEDERRRIQDKGGCVELCGRVWRVAGMLVVSRSIGDAYLKDWILAEPETKTLELTQDMEYLVMASDGLWDEVSNEEAINIVKGLCHIKEKGKAALDEKDNNVHNTDPSSKIMRALKVKENCGYESPHKHLKEKVNLDGLTATCKELANLAIWRGSIDDITVLIIDLYQFKV